MKKIYLLIFPVLSLFACKKGNDLPREETITKGDKWGLTIGSSYDDVYSRLQTLGKEKNFTDVAVAYRQPYSKPQEIQQILPFYQAITLMSDAVVIDRVMIEFPEDKVKSISAGGALPDEISKWPDGASDEVAIHANDPVDQIYTKLLAIYQLPAYSNYTIILPGKPLNKPFDPDMAHYDQWAFTFSVQVRSDISGTSAVRLFFKNGKLDKIQHDYNESKVYN